MVEDVVDGTIDVGFLWGPIAGYYRKQDDLPLTLVPLQSEPGAARMEYHIAMGVRANEPEWRRRINAAILKRQAEITAILRDYGVPLLNERGAHLPLRAATLRPAVLRAGPRLGPDRRARARAQTPEPEGYRMDDYRAPTPETVPGGVLLDTDTATNCGQTGNAVWIDVLPAPRRPANLPAVGIWMPLPHRNIPGSLWLPDIGRGALSPELEAYFRDHLEAAVKGLRTLPIVFYCLADCWMSWNATKRAASWGYTKLYWYRDGTDGWQAAKLPMANVEPVPAP